MHHDVFISYSSMDKETADAVCSMLEQNGISCWMAPRNITPGIPFAEAIIDGIKSSKVFVLVYTSNSNNSTQVIREVDRAVHHGLSVINLRLEDVPLSKQLEYYISSVHWMDAMTSPLEKHLQQLCYVAQIFLKPKDVKDAEISEALRKGIIKQNEPTGTGKGYRMVKRRTILGSGILLAVAIVVVSIVVFNIGGIRKARAGSIESIVILPFGNYTGVDTLDPFISTMHSLLINEIGKIPGLRIIGRVSSDLYKNADKSIQQIAKELKVDAAIELDVLCLGDTICMQPRLMSGGTEEKQLWIGDYREAKGNLFNLYNRIIRQIASEVKISLTPAQEAMMAESSTIDPDAIDAYLKGLYYWDQFSPETLELALKYFNKAIAIDPDWALPYAGVSYYWGAITIMGLAPDSITRPRVYENLERAFKLDPKSDFILYRRAGASVWAEFNWKKGEQEFLQVLEINPNHAFARIYYGHLLACLKRDTEAQEQGEIAVMLDPLNPMIQSMYALLLGSTGEYDKGIEFAEKALAVAPDNVGAWSALKYCYFGKGEYRKAFDTWMRFTPLDENTRSAILATCDGDGYVLAAEKFAEEWENAGCSQPTDIVEAYIIAKNYSKAMDWLEKAYEDHDHNIPYFGLTMFQKEPYKIDDPRFYEFLKKLNLPLPETD